MLLQDRVIILVGVGPGLGRATALAMAREGADLVLGARRQHYLEEVAGEVQALGRRVVVVPTDIAETGQCRRIAEATMEAFGRIDVLVNNAGWVGPHRMMLDMPMEDWQDIVDGNLVGQAAMCRFAAPHMVEAGKGAIVNVVSRSMRHGAPERTAYAAAKAGITAMSYNLAFELGPKGVRVNCLAPGQMGSEKIHAWYRQMAADEGTTFEAIHERLAGTFPLGRIMEPEEVALAIVFLASDLASGITGQTLDVNCGQYFH